MAALERNTRSSVQAFSETDRAVLILHSKNTSANQRRDAYKKTHASNCCVSTIETSDTNLFVEQTTAWMITSTVNFRTCV